MILSLITTTLLAMFMTLTLMKNPLMIMLYIILISLILAMLFSMTMSSWFAFLMFLIYVSGMLVMFAYFAATTPNQSSMKTKPLLYMTLILMITLLGPSMNLFTIPLMHTSKQQMMTMFFPQNMFLLILITLILLLTMIIIVKITMRSKGPMRSFM